MPCLRRDDVNYRLSRDDPHGGQPRRLHRSKGRVGYSILPILIGDGIPFFDRLDRDIALHLAEVKAYDSGIVELRYEVRR